MNSSFMSFPQYYCTAFSKQLLQNLMIISVIFVRFHCIWLQEWTCMPCYEFWKKIAWTSMKTMNLVWKFLGDLDQTTPVFWSVYHYRHCLSFCWISSNIYCVKVFNSYLLIVIIRWSIVMRVMQSKLIWVDLIPTLFFTIIFFVLIATSFDQLCEDWKKGWIDIKQPICGFQTKNRKNADQKGKDFI